MPDPRNSIHLLTGPGWPGGDGFARRFTGCALFDERAEEREGADFFLVFDGGIEFNGKRAAKTSRSSYGNAHGSITTIAMPPCVLRPPPHPTPILRSRIAAPR